MVLLPIPLLAGGHPRRLPCRRHLGFGSMRGTSPRSRRCCSIVSILWPPRPQLCARR